MLYELVPALAGIFLLIVKFAILFFVIKYAVKSAMKPKGKKNDRD